MDDFVAILKTEYSTAFDEHRKKAMINSFYKYGPAKKNYGEYKCIQDRSHYIIGSYGNTCII